MDSLGIHSFDMSQGSFPLDRGSVGTEIFASSTGVVTPSMHIIWCPVADNLQAHSWTLSLPRPG